MKWLFIAPLIVLLSVAACAQGTTKKPADFSLALDWHSGSLPEPYAYAFALRLGPGPDGELVYRPGGQSGEWQTKFNLPEGRLDALYQFLAENKALRSRWQEGDPVDGAPWTAIQMRENGRGHTIPTASELSETERGLVEHIIAEIRDCVPPEVWEEMEARQARVESEFFNGQ